LSISPPSSYKWTWGESLTEKEVLALYHSRTKPHSPHSGYDDVSLRDGKLTGEESAPPLLDVVIFNGDDIGVNPAAVSSLTDLELPSFFLRQDHRQVYDPLHFSNPSVSCCFENASSDAVTPPLQGETLKIVEI
jgi:hypothetical protein